MEEPISVENVELCTIRTSNKQLVHCSKEEISRMIATLN